LARTSTAEWGSFDGKVDLLLYGLTRYDIGAALLSCDAQR